MATKTSAPRGRPRSLTAQRAILEAARALVTKGGYQAATVEAIAERSGVAKTTIYRWWPNRTALLVDLLVQMSAAAVPPPAGTDPLRALKTELRGIAAVGDQAPGRLLTSLLGEAQHDPEIRGALVDGLFQVRRAASANAIRQAQLAGKLRADVPPSVAVDLLVGPVFFRMFVGHEPNSESYVDHAFQQFVRGLAPAPKARRRTKKA